MGVCHPPPHTPLMCVPALQSLKKRFSAQFLVSEGSYGPKSYFKRESTLSSQPGPMLMQLSFFPYPHPGTGGADAGLFGSCSLKFTLKFLTCHEFHLSPAQHAGALTGIKRELLFAKEHCPNGRGHHLLSQEKNVNDPTSAPPIQGGVGAIR